ncbi:MAG TPA: hypothetical protein VHO91_09350 [Rhodopila sp.]|nr:hypothetical protein [Rhodopila sp.]
MHLTYYDAWLKVPDVSGDEATASFPPARRDAFFHIRDAILSARLRGEQIDHLVWRAAVTKREVEELLCQIYGPPGSYEADHDAGLSHLADKMRAFRAFVAGLPTDRDIVLMADEF